MLYATVGERASGLFAINVSFRRMIASPLQIIMSLFADNVSRSAFLYAINVSRKLSCLQAGAFMFASRNIQEREIEVRFKSYNQTKREKI